MRLFAAVNFPEKVREEIWRAAAPLREAGFPVRWVDARRLHMTLKFLGEVDGSAAEAVEGALAGVARGFVPLNLRLGGVEGFPSLRAPRVVWLGVEAPPDLGRLRDSVEEALVAHGFPREGRAFHPHLTLGRARREARSPAFQGLEDAAGEVGFRARCRVAGIDLMRSVLRPSGAEYSVVTSFPLVGSSGEGTAGHGSAGGGSAGEGERTPEAGAGGSEDG